MEELVITETNFKDYFRDVKNNKPERGDVIARYTAKAEFLDGHMKRNIIDLLKKDKAFAAVQVMRRLGSATEKDSVRICKEICKDLASGMDAQEVEFKVYSYQLETFYYVKKDHVPDDPHWTIISINNLDDFLDKAGNKIKMTAKVLNDSEN